MTDRGIELPRSPASGRAKSSWASYWDGLEERAVFRPEAADYVARLDTALGLDPNARVLDFGCGFGFVAEILSTRVRQVWVCDSSEPMVTRTLRRLAGRSNVRWVGADRTEGWAAGLSFDLILVNSVVQYMRPEEFHRWLSHWPTRLAPRGRLVLSDLLVDDPRPGRELAEMLALGARGGVLLRTMWDGAAELWRYARARRARPLQRVELNDLRERAQRLGLALDLLPFNLTYRRRRATAVLSV